MNINPKQEMCLLLPNVDYYYYNYYYYYYYCYYYDFHTDFSRLALIGFFLL